MQGEVAGYYLDGRTAARRRATVKPTRMGLQVETEQGASFFWPYEEASWSTGVGHDEQLRIERGEDVLETLLVPAGPFMQAFRFAAPERAKRFDNRFTRGSLLLKIVGSALGSAVLVLAAYLWGIPALASVVAPHVPLKWEENLGQGVVDFFAPRARQCEEPGGTRAINEVMARLNAKASNNRYTFRVIVVNDPWVNALAAPGGYILVFRGLLESTRTPDELAGVLAHEMQHILRGHAMRQLLQQASLKVLLAAITGNLSEATSYGLGAANTLAVLRYSRQYEEEADREAIRLLAAAGLEPMGLARFFETLKKKDGSSGKLPAYLSTHPDLDERIRKASLLAEQAGASRGLLVQEYNWKEMSSVCGKTGAQPNP
jgi:predicted Zn-dependent protease